MRCWQRLQAYVAQVHTPEAQVFGEQYEFEYYRRFVICLKARVQRTHGSSPAPPAAIAARHALHARPGPGEAGPGAARLLLCRRVSRRPGDPARLAGRESRPAHRAHARSIRSSCRCAPSACICTRSISASTHAFIAAALQEAIADTIAAVAAQQPVRRNRQRARDLPRGGRDQERLLARGHSPIRHQRRCHGGRCARRRAAGPPGRRARSKARAATPA